MAKTHRKSEKSDLEGKVHHLKASFAVAAAINIIKREVENLNEDTIQEMVQYRGIPIPVDTIAKSFFSSLHRVYPEIAKGIVYEATRPYFTESQLRKIAGKNISMAKQKKRD